MVRVHNLAQFSREFRRVALKMPEREIVPFHRAIALEALKRLVLKSPVGNPEIWLVNEGKSKGDPDWVGKGYVGGRFKGNWQLTINQRPDEPIDVIDASGGQTLSKGQAGLAPLRAYETVYLTNNVEYAQTIEDGRRKSADGGFTGSTQSPQGVLGVTFAELVELFP